MIRDLEVRDGETGLSARNSYWCDTGDVGDWAKKVIAMDAYHMLQASPTLYNINKGHATGNANCGNLYCTQYAQIVWCNVSQPYPTSLIFRNWSKSKHELSKTNCWIHLQDNQEHGFMAHGYELAPYVKQIIDACTYEDTVRGQLWGDGGWNLKIVGDKGLT